MTRRPLLPVLTVAFALASCHGSSRHGGLVDARIDREAIAAPGNGPNDPVPSRTPTTTTGAERVHYALARHLARAELREGATLVVDLGVPGAAKYTLGGWLTNTGDDRVLGGATVTTLQGTTTRLAIESATAEAQELVVRARGTARDRLRLFVDDHEVGGADVPGDGNFGIARIAIPAGVLAPGEHTLLLRTVHPGMALDWLRLGVHPGESMPPAPAALVVPDGHDVALHLPAGLALGYALEVPRGAHLRATATGAGHLDVVALTDGAAARTVASAATTAGGAVDFDLGPEAGHVTRLDLRATSGDVTLASPRIVTLDGAAARGTSRAHNVILYLVDTLRADKLRPLNGETRVRTPGLDRFAAGATIMSEAHTQENWTKPSVATLLSSLFPWQHNAISTEAVVPESVALLPEVLGADGYYTGAFIANGYVSDRFGFRQGWTTYRNYVREGRRNTAQYVAADVLEWLDHRPADKPFMLYVHAIDPHVPYKPPQHFLEMYDANPYSGVVDFTGDNELLEKVKAGRIHLNDRDKIHLEALYDGEISYHDVHFAAILEGLDRRHLADDTMVVVVADHGEEFWDHGSVGHGHSVWEELLHVPMFVRLPGVTQGTQRVDEPVGLVDVMPTILDALGQPIPTDLAGQSFLPLLRGESADAPRAAVSGFMEGWRTCVAGRFKLVHRTVARTMLYDLGADAHEQHDLAAGHPVAVRYLRGLLGLELAQSDTNVAPAGVAIAPHRPVVHAQETTTIDAETEAQLRALGYVAGSRR